MSDEFLTTGRLLAIAIAMGAIVVAMNLYKGEYLTAGISGLCLAVAVYYGVRYAVRDGPI